MAGRLWEVDAARGFALALMLVFNWSFALRFLDVVHIAPEDSWLYWWAFPRFIGFLFVFIVGVSLTLSQHRLRRHHPHEWWRRSLRKYPRRGLWILGLGLAITVVTYVLYPDRYVYFGVLHLIGASIVLVVPLIHRRWASLVLGSAIIIAANWVQEIAVDGRLLGVVGFDAGVPSLDYFPLIPWTGVVLLGIWTGHTLFPDGERRIALPSLDVHALLAVTMRPLQVVGRHTLAIYLAHQPALGLLLLLLGFDVL